MIVPAVVAGAVCLLLAGYDLLWRSGQPEATMRIPIAASWAVTWLAYGLNLGHYPQPSATTMVFLSMACAASWALVPRAESRRFPNAGAMPQHSTEPWPRVYFLLLVLLAGFVFAWDCWHIARGADRYGFVEALIIHRLQRGLKEGAYSLPGMSMAHAIAAVAGAMGYAMWVRHRSRLGVVAAVLGVAATLTSTGRWEIVGFALWCLVIDVVYNRTRSPRQVALAQVRLFALLAIFFVIHGTLFRKTESLTHLARMGSIEQRLARVNVPTGLGVTRGSAPLVPSAPGSARMPRAVAKPTAPAPSGPAPPRPGTNSPPERVLPPMRQAETACPRWVDGTTEANRALRSMGGLKRMLVTYFSGPPAAFDRVTCEGRQASRPVVFYWPHKIGQLAGLIPPATMVAVDPFVDIGLPFNNFTVAYPFWSEFGPWLGALAWVATAFALRAFIRWTLARPETLAWVVAGTAPVGIAVRTPWTNSFFDGTLFAYILTPVAGWLLGRLLLARRPDPPTA